MRTNVVGNILFSLFLVLHLIGGLGVGWSWVGVVVVVATAVLYVVVGGLASDVIYQRPAGGGNDGGLLRALGSGLRSA